MIKSIVKGLAHLSKNYVMHRDIKLDNVFVKSKNIAKGGHMLPLNQYEFKIGDFGLAKRYKT